MTRRYRYTIGRTNRLIFLDIKKGEKIPPEVLDWASTQPGKLGLRARLAKRLIGYQKKKKRR